MADEHDKWLNRDAADRLLRGEAPAVSGDDARRADRLSSALYALAEVPAGPEGELPGEDAALKAFRETRAVTAVNGAVNEAASGPVRPGRARRAARPAPKAARRPRWGRPARLGAVAAFAACMVGGVAVAAGTGVLPSPFRGSDDPAPAASVSAAASPDRPLASASAGVTEDGHAVPKPTESSGPPGGGSASGPPPRDRSAGEPPDGRTSQHPRPDASAAEGAKAQARKLVETCRKYRGGESGAADVQRLEASAKALGQDTRSLGRFCDRVLARSGAPTSSADRTASHDTGDKSGSGSKTASSDDGGGSGGKGDGKGDAENDDEDGDRAAGASPSASPSVSPSASLSPDAAPSATLDNGVTATPTP
ncbi:hypothetical protein ACFV9W_24985 [Streptomyces sp. NPDC059897]|uniref:hypothetical protein n=1 Tax=Streptomyces sp. NPDC059897 TaxID=3346994 RepID=UPI003649B88B